MDQGQIVLVDTNIIIEAFRTRCWKALTTYYRVETVEKCCEEALTGDRRRPGYVEVDTGILKKKLVIHRVESLEQAALALACPDVDALDAGERHLFAHAHSRTDAWIGDVRRPGGGENRVCARMERAHLFAGGAEQAHGRETGVEAPFHRGLVVGSAHRFCVR